MASYETDWVFFLASYFVTASIVRNHVRRGNSLSDLHPMHTLRLWQPGDDSEDGIPGNLSDVCFLCKH